MSNAFKLTGLASLLMLVAVGWHFGTVAGLWGQPPGGRIELFVRIGLMTAFTVIGTIAAAILVAVRTGDEQLDIDEREAIIEQKAERNGYFALATAALGVIWLAFDPLTPMQLANLMLAAMALGEIVKLASAGFYIWRGA